MNSGNLLSREKSPYLLQHADNPVHWKAWNQAAFDEAKKEDKPIFLSIGYSTCHWCHVMKRESFENPKIADILNQHFISIKVDREERPDVDRIYMEVALAFNGRGGWPLTIIMTPDKKPFYAGTYLPPESRQGQSGLKELLQTVEKMWREDRQRLLMTSDGISQTLNEDLAQLQQRSGSMLSKEQWQNSINAFEKSYDRSYGGFGSRPKFPMPGNLLYLIQYASLFPESSAFDMLEETLVAMRKGGIYDHVGFGFHRYSTDRIWLVPHFEKMLYDQAMLILVYSQAYQKSSAEDKKMEFKEIVYEILAYLKKKMLHADGAFYSAEDAESGGEEGKFYVWSWNELTGFMNPDQLAFLEQNFNLKKDGNFIEEGKRDKSGDNILYLKKSLNATQKIEWEKIRQVLHKERNKRKHPGLDDKILTDWNGMMIAALAQAGRIFQDPELMNMAEKNLSFIKKKLYEDRLHHLYRDGHRDVSANLDDYAYLTWGLLELYQANGKTEHLFFAQELLNESIRYLWSPNGFFYFIDAKTANDLITRPTEFHDGAIPAGNSIQIMNLMRLGKIIFLQDYIDMAEKASSFVTPEYERIPTAFPLYLFSSSLLIYPFREVVVAGFSNDEKTEQAIAQIRAQADSSTVVIDNRFSKELKPYGDISQLNEFLPNQAPINDKVTFYVCRNYSCKQPTNDLEAALKLMRE